MGFFNQLNSVFTGGESDTEKRMKKKLKKLQKAAAEYGREAPFDQLLLLSGYDPRKLRKKERSKLIKKLLARNRGQQLTSENNEVKSASAAVAEAELEVAQLRAAVESSGKRVVRDALRAAKERRELARTLLEAAKAAAKAERQQQEQAVSAGANVPAPAATGTGGKP